MISVRAAAILSLVALSCDAQITTTLTRLPDGMEEVRIRNGSATNLIAYVVTVKQVPRSSNTINAPHVFYSDPLIEPSIVPLPPGDERLVVRRGLYKERGNLAATRVFEEPVNIAGVFADGSTFGGAALLNRLILRRSNMLLAVETSLDLLVDAGNRNIAREHLVKQFSRMAAQLNRWYVAPEQQIGRTLYQSIVGKLTNLPAQPVGSPFPPSAFVAEQTAALNRQRVALLESQPSLELATLIGPP